MSLGPGRRLQRFLLCQVLVLRTEHRPFIEVILSWWLSKSGEKINCSIKTQIWTTWNKGIKQTLAGLTVCNITCLLPVHAWIDSTPNRKNYSKSHMMWQIFYRNLSLKNLFAFSSGCMLNHICHGQVWRFLFDELCVLLFFSEERSWQILFQSS